MSGNLRRRVLRGAEYRDFAGDSPSPANARSITFFDRRAILNVGQLLTGSRIAQAAKLPASGNLRPSWTKVWAVASRPRVRAEQELASARTWVHPRTCLRASSQRHTQPIPDPTGTTEQGSTRDPDRNALNAPRVSAPSG